VSESISTSLDSSLWRMMKEQELLDEIIALAPLLESHAVEAEQRRMPIDSVMEAVEATQMYRYFVPRQYGGFEFSLDGL